MNIVRPPLAPGELSPPQHAGQPDQSAPPDTALLIREARQRQRKRRSLALVVGALVVLVGGLAYLLNGGTPLTRPSRTANRQGSLLSAGPFAGPWHLQTFNLTIQPDGRGVFEFPIKVNCGTGIGKGPPPCDKVVTKAFVLNGKTQTEEIRIDGGRANLRLTTVGSSIAHAIIARSADQSEVPNGPAILKVTRDDLLYIYVQKQTGPSPLKPNHPAPLCGPRASALSAAVRSYAQEQALGFNCD
jgi:hypothetical protein